MRPVPFLAVSLAVLLGVVRAGTAAPPEAAVERLVRQLGGEKCDEWEAACRLHEAWGDEALPALRKTRHSGDPEVRCLAADILPALEALGELTATRAALVAVWDLDGKLGPAEEYPGEAVAWVNLCGSRTTDADLAHLTQVPGLAGLCELFLDRTQVTDAGLAHLSGFRRLVRLDLQGTAVTDEGLARIGEMSRLLWLDLGRTAVTDAGLAHLGKLEDLRILNVRGSRVTDDGIARLMKALPGLRVRR
jgi:hypothetical protein